MIIYRRRIKYAEFQRLIFTQLFHSLDNNSTIMAVDENGEYRPIWCSGEYAEMMEGEAEECIRYEASEENVSVHPEDKDEVAYLFNNQKTRDGKNSLTIRKLTLKGNEIWVNVHFAFVKDEGIQYAYCSYTDAKTIPIIAMTANAFDEDVQRSLQAGMNAHLSKPVEQDKLFLTLGELIKG